MTGERERFAEGVGINDLTMVFKLLTHLSIYSSIPLSSIHSPSIFPSIFLSIHLYTHPPLCLSILSFIHPTISSFIHPAIFLSSHASFHLSFHLSIHPPVLPPTHPSCHPPIQCALKPFQVQQSVVLSAGMW